MLLWMLLMLLRMLSVTIGGLLFARNTFGPAIYLVCCCCTIKIRRGCSRHLRPSTTTPIRQVLLEPTRRHGG